MAPHSPRNSASSPLPPLRSARLLDQLRERIRYDHYSLRTEQSYVHWVRRFVHFHVCGIQRRWVVRGRGFAHLANARQVSPSHQLALCALLYPSYIH